MVGHSKWMNIQHKKARQGTKRGEIFTRLVKGITIVIHMGGGGPDASLHLHLALEKVAENSIPEDNAQRLPLIHISEPARHS